jgi:valyl-tRNA synthetase
VKAYQTKSTKPKGIPGLPPAQPATAKPVKKESKEKVVKPPSSSSSSSTASNSTSDALKLEKLSISTPAVNSVASSSNITSDVDIDKKIKALKKKLRDVEELAKKDQTSLNPEQLEKLSKQTSLEDEIRTLESAKSK